MAVTSPPVPASAGAIAIGAYAPFGRGRASSPLGDGGDGGVSPPSPASLESRRPSPWHEVAHSLRGTGTPSPGPALTSTALRAWDRQVAEADAVRHALPSCGSPRLSAERDRAGHVEYKLKLLAPGPERFERLVTQMAWRLKQGANEAIYELGLADDGAVVGLSRAEMDASLATLERMAAELGATVLVLKEIVLDDSASSASSTSDASGTSASGSTGGWAHRPDLDELGRPRRGTKTLADLDDAAAAPAAGASSADIPPFSLDDAHRTSPVSIEGKAAAKRRKAAQRREARRLDLLRGDGTASASPSVSEGLGSGVSGGASPASASRPGSGLASAASADGHGHGSGTPDEAFIDGLAIPLDTLSLSFADMADADERPGHEERICVEALVVRKSAVDEYYGEEDSWGFGED